MLHTKAWFLSPPLLSILSYSIAVVLQRELQDSKAVHGDNPQQPPLVSLNSWSQSAAAEHWDAFSNHSDAIATEPLVHMAPACAQASPLSPQRQAAAAKAKAFIKSQASNVKSMQVRHFANCALSGYMERCPR